MLLVIGNVTSLFDWNVRRFSENLDLEVEALPQVLRGSSSVSSRFVDYWKLERLRTGTSKHGIAKKAHLIQLGIELRIRAESKARLVSTDSTQSTEYPHSAPWVFRSRRVFSKVPKHFVLVYRIIYYHLIRVNHLKPHTNCDLKCVVTENPLMALLEQFVQTDEVAYGWRWDPLDRSKYEKTIFVSFLAINN